MTVSLSLPRDYILCRPNALPIRQNIFKRHPKNGNSLTQKVGNVKVIIHFSI